MLCAHIAHSKDTHHHHSDVPEPCQMLNTVVPWMDPPLRGSKCLPFYITPLPAHKPLNSLSLQVPKQLGGL